MTWLSLATGSTGVYWFLYQSEHTDPAHLMEGVVDRNFKPHPNWDEIGRLTKEIGAISSTLLQLKPDPENAPTIIRKKSRYAFVDSAGHHYVIAINMDTEKPQTLHLKIRTSGTKVVRLPENAKIDAHREGDGLAWQQEFAPGSGALYQID